MTPKTRRLLCVEDDEDTCIILKFLLNEFDVEAVPTGKQALEKLEDGGYSLIIMDLRLPDMSGAEVVCRIREIDAFTPIIFFTGSPEFTAQRAREVGAQDIVLKGKPDFATELQKKADKLAMDLTGMSTGSRLSDEWTGNGG
jgi:CheY-like chemotaxis protein